MARSFFHLSAAGRIGGLVKASRYPPQELTAPARQGFLSRFLKEADPERTLPPEERQRRATCLLRAHMLRLAHASAKARQRVEGGGG